MKTKLKKWLILIVWMFIIFIFSNQPHSGSVTHDMVEQILPNIKFDSLINIINFTIRKLAHLSEYFILTLLTISLSKEYIKKEKIILLRDFSKINLTILVNIWGYNKTPFF